MKCFYCGYSKTIVLDSRGKENFSKVMRRRCCPKCKKRATTFESIYQHYGSSEEDFSTNSSLLALYKSIVKQIHLLEKSIKLINPDKFKRTNSNDYVVPRLGRGIQKN
jgi:hypothetical protein